MPTDPLTLPSEVLVHLLDTVTGRRVQTWRFLKHEVITIGRSEDRDIVLSDPVVSRCHAELRWRDGKWLLIPLGRNGVMVENRPVTEFPIAGTGVFRLGATGPTLQFQPHCEAEMNRSTLCFEGEMPTMYELDRDRLDKEVREITEDPYFQNLQAMARQLRQRRGIGNGPT